MATVRDDKGRFVPGHKPSNNSGRPKEVAEVRKLARQYTTEAIETLAEVMRTDKRGSTRVAAANAILDRGYGKPAQSIEMSVETMDDADVLNQTLEILNKIKEEKSGDAPPAMQ